MSYTRSELVREAAKRGHLVSERLVTDWASLGLLDHPKRTGRGSGAGRGARYEFSDHQRDLLLALLARRAEHRDVRRLANIPVSVWLYLGDDLISTDQVRRALATWVDLDGQSSVGRRDQIARRVVNEVAAPDAPLMARQRLQRALTQGDVAEKVFESLLSDVVEPRLTRGNANTDQHLLFAVWDFLEPFWIGMHALAEIDEEALLKARDTHRRLHHSHVAEAAVLGTERPYGSWLNRFSFLVERACRDLVYQLGEDERDRAASDRLRARAQRAKKKQRTRDR